MPLSKARLAAHNAARGYFDVAPIAPGQLFRGDYENIAAAPKLERNVKRARNRQQEAAPGFGGVVGVRRTDAALLDAFCRFVFGFWVDSAEVYFMCVQWHNSLGLLLL